MRLGLLKDVTQLNSHALGRLASFLTTSDSTLNYIFGED